MKSNESLPLKVANQLKKDALLKDVEIAVAISNREVLVTGKVDKFFKKELVCKLVKEVTGIKNVVDAIEVVIPEENQPQDKDIIASIAEKLEKNLGSSYKNIDVAVNAGHVVLDGILKWHYQILLATECIALIDGIVTIQNNITTGAVTELLLSEKDILAAIYKEKMITADITVDLNGRKVTLTGKVPTAAQKNLVEKIVTDLSGIEEVVSKLQIENN
ncbi:BON domain-containing protein [Flavobacterium phycosphaerae]|uniref:BON domain-containing protein n=1 Tax=Flavobacterium phycosphaerae TaxID=2697515 RepID=UPI001389AEF0|nr:BON domain-containing protein [Flavobacterium phycosphaerae]